jgi:NCS1 family nucleobase:cation symporter-1
MMGLSLICSDTLNAYTASFQVLAFGNMWRRFKSVSVAVRLIPFVCVMVVGVLVAFVGYKHFVSNLSNFLDVLLVVFIPWSAVNLTDYFLVRRARYDVGSFFVKDGIYGMFAWRGLLAYAVGLGAEWPFVSQPDYTGPLVAKLGGADISWIVGWFVSAALYLVLMRTAPTGRRRVGSHVSTAARRTAY